MPLIPASTQKRQQVLEFEVSLVKASSRTAKPVYRKLVWGGRTNLKYYSH